MSKGIKINIYRTGGGHLPRYLEGYGGEYADNNFIIEEGDKCKNCKKELVDPDTQVNCHHFAIPEEHNHVLYTTKSVM